MYSYSSLCTPFKAFSSLYDKPKCFRCSLPVSTIYFHKLPTLVYIITKTYRTRKTKPMGVYPSLLSR